MQRLVGVMAATHIGEYALTQHAAARIRQRGLCRQDLELVIAHGEPVDDGYVMSREVIKARKCELVAEMKRLERLNGIVVIDQGGRIVTIYRADKQRMRSLRRER